MREGEIRCWEEVQPSADPSAATQPGTSQAPHILRRDRERVQQQAMEWNH